MEINVREDRKIVDIWLTNEEKNDPTVRERLKEIYAKYASTPYTVAVFFGGLNTLYDQTKALSRHNKRTEEKHRMKESENNALR